MQPVAERQSSIAFVVHVQHMSKGQVLAMAFEGIPANQFQSIDRAPSKLRLSDPSEAHEIHYLSGIIDAWHSGAERHQTNPVWDQSGGDSVIPASRIRSSGWNTGTPASCTRTQGTVARVYGIDFSLYIDGQNPNFGAQIPPAQMMDRLQIIARNTVWIRSFSSTSGLEKILPAEQVGLKVAGYAWISTDLAQNQLEINHLIAAAQSGQVDIAIVGSEAVLCNDATPSQIVAYMNQVRSAIPAGIPVTTADVWGTFIDHPELIAASDVIFANLYPYREGTSTDSAMCSLEQEYQQLVSAAKWKPVWVSETGWPSVGNAVPSVASANLFADQFLTWASASNIPSSYLEVFDDGWKIASEGPQGAHWGIWDSTGVLKPGMDAFFNGSLTAANCNGTIPVPVAMNSVCVPPYGADSLDRLEVQVAGVQPGGYKIAAYIRVGGDWGTKPVFAQPTVGIDPDRRASIATLRGGSDQNTTSMAVYLIPTACMPPRFSGGALPSVPCAVTSKQISRTVVALSGAVNGSNPIVGVPISAYVLGTTMSAPDGKYSFSVSTI